MEGLKQSLCKDCGKAVFFALDEKGTRQILDAVAAVWVRGMQFTAAGEPVADDRVIKLHDAYVSHFLTCPVASQFSKHNQCQCGHSKAEHPDNMLCRNEWCVCPAFQAKEPTK